MLARWLRWERQQSVRHWPADPRRRFGLGLWLGDLLAGWLGLRPATAAAAVDPGGDRAEDRGRPGAPKRRSGGTGR